MKPRDFGNISDKPLHYGKPILILFLFVIIVVLAVGGILYMEHLLSFRYDHSYDLVEIAKHKTPTAADSSRVSAIAELLPMPDEDFTFLGAKEDRYHKPAFRVDYESIFDLDFCSLLPYWDEFTSHREQTIVKISEQNALVMFVMIDDLQEVIFSYHRVIARDLWSSFIFYRADYEAKYGDLSALGEDLEGLAEILAKGYNASNTPDEN